MYNFMMVNFLNFTTTILFDISPFFCFFMHNIIVLKYYMFSTYLIAILLVIEKIEGSYNFVEYYMSKRSVICVKYLNV